MIVSCPTCQEKLEIDSSHLEASTSIVCLSCRSRFKMNVTLEVLSEPVRERAQGPAPLRSNPVDRDAVLVAVDGEATNELIADLLKQAGLRPIESKDGLDAIALLRQQRPGAALIDVGLSEVLGIQLWDEIKNDPQLKDTVVILVASIYDKTKYKRPPGSLYGAEDYVERHQIQDDLLLKLKKHLIRSSPAVQAPVQVKPPPAPEAPRAAPQERPSPQPAKARQGAPPASVLLTPEQEAAKRLARIIIADIVLYNQGEAEKGVRNGSFKQLLSDPLAEGRRHYDSRVSEELRRSTNYFDEAIEEFIQKKRAAM